MDVVATSEVGHRTDHHVAWGRVGFWAGCLGAAGIFVESFLFALDQLNVLTPALVYPQA